MKRSKYIDHTLLKADATKQQIVKLCEEAKEYDFASVCVNPSWCELASEILKGTDVKTCVVVGFPLGSMTTDAKVAETKDAIEKGADEVDMVIQVGRLKDGDDAYVTEEIRRLKQACGDKVLKVIIEACLLNDEEKKKSMSGCIECRCGFCKNKHRFFNRRSNS